MKKQARDAKFLKQLKETRASAKKERVDKRKLYMANAEKYFKEYAATDKNLIDEKRKAKSAGNFFVESEPKVAFAIRIRG